MAPQATAKPASTQADEFLRRGISAQQQGDLNAAIAAYKQAVTLNPALGEAHANLGAALAAAGQFDDAIEEDKRAIELVPDTTSVRMNLALAYYKKGDLEHARLEFEAVHAARPQDLNAAILLAYSDLKLNRADDASRVLAPLAAANVANPDFQYVLALAQIQSGNLTDGLPRMEKVASETRSPDAYVIAGQAHMDHGQYPQARADFDAALQLAPTFPGLHTLAGMARDANGDQLAARPEFEAALRDDPKDFNANLHLGGILLKNGEIDAARPLLETALQLQPNFPYARFEMARLNRQTGHYDEAVKTLEELSKADPNWLDVHVELAALYYKLNRPQDGRHEREIVQQIEAKQQRAAPKPVQ